MIQVVQIPPDVVAKNWNEVGPLVLAALPPVDHNDSNRALKLFISGTWTCWALMHDGKIKAIGTTKVVVNDAGERSLDVVSLFSVNFEHRLPVEAWAVGVEAWKKHAKLNGCKSVKAISRVPRVAEIAKQTGADTSCVILEWRL
jgi:hypothetical protein